MGNRSESFGQYAENMVQNLKLILRLPSNFKPIKIERASIKIIQQFDNIVPRKPETDNIKETYVLLWKIRNNLPKLEQIKRKCLKRAPWVLFCYPENNQSQWLGNDRIFSKFFTKWLTVNLPSSTIRALAHVYLRDYPCYLEVFRPWRIELTNVLQKCKRDPVQRLRDRFVKYQLLSEDGLQKFVSMLLEADQNVEDFLKEAGFTGELANAHFLLEAQKTMIDSIEYLLRDQPEILKKLDRALIFITGEANTLRYRELRVQVAESLLERYMKFEPPQSIREKLQKFFLDIYGHPLVNISDWQGISERAKDVMNRWLIDDTLLNFFDLIRRTTRKESQWRYRHAFWNAYHKKGHITAAWVALPPNAQWAARDLEQHFGHLHVRIHRSVLLLRLRGGMTVTECSHDGKCRIWTVQNKAKPKMGKKEYNWFELVDRPNEEYVHSGANVGRWQERVSTYIEEMTGIQLNSKDYMPKV